MAESSTQPTEEISDLDELERKIAELEKKNSEKSSHFGSLKIVLAGLKNDNVRLKAENSERKNRHNRLEKLQENLNKFKDSTKELIEIVYKLYGIIKSSDYGERHRTASIEEHLRVQKDLYEKIEKLKTDHENRPIVKKQKEVQGLENSILESFEILVQQFQAEEKDMENSLNDWDGKICRKIVVLVQNWKALTEETGVNETTSIQSGSCSDSTLSGSNTQRPVNQPFSTQKSKGFSFPKLSSRPPLLVLEEDPEFDKKMAEFKKMVETRINFSSSSPMQNTRTSSSNLLSNERRFENKAQTLSTSMVYRIQAGQKQVSTFETFTKASHTVIAPSQSIGQRTVSTGFELENPLPSNNYPQNIEVAVQKTTTETIRVSRVDSTLPVIITNGAAKKNENVPIVVEERETENENKVGVPDSKKITVLNDVIIKAATGASISSKLVSDKNQYFAPVGPITNSVRGNVQSANNVFSIQSTQKQDSVNAYQSKLQKLMNISDKVSSSVCAKEPSTVSNDTQQNNIISSVEENYFYVKPGHEIINRSPRETGNDHIQKKTTTTKQHSQDTANGIKMDTSENVVIDLNSELPTSHITINSSTEQHQPDQSPMDQSLDFPDEFLSDFSKDMPSRKNNSEKHKESNNMVEKRATLDDAFDLGSFDLSQKSKKLKGVDGDEDDFFNMFGASPSKAGNDGDDDFLEMFKASPSKAGNNDDDDFLKMFRASPSKANDDDKDFMKFDKIFDFE